MVLVVPSGSGCCSLKASSDVAVIQISGRRCQDYRHCIWMDGADLRVRLRREERE
jgi:hypothetical protein